MALSQIGRCGGGPGEHAIPWREATSMEVVQQVSSYAEQLTIFSTSIEFKVVNECNERISEGKYFFPSLSHTLSSFPNPSNPLLFP